MDTTKLQALLMAADQGSISKAADLLGYTQSGITHMMNSLDAEMGIPLLVRGNRGVTLTAEGERLAPLFRELIACAERIEQELALTRGLERGTIRIGAYSSISMHWMPSILEAFQSQYPNIHVKLFEGDNHEIEKWLAEGFIDLGFTSLQPHQHYECIKIQDDPMMAVLPRNHPLAGAEVFPIDAFGDDPFLIYTPSVSPDEDLKKAMMLAGIKDNTKFLSNFDLTIIAMVEHNLGITIMPALIVDGTNYDVAAIPIDPPITRTLGMVMRSKESLSPAMQRLIDCAKQVLNI